MSHTRLMLAVLVSAIVMLYAVPVMAGVGGNEFQPMYQLFKDWSEGYLGRLVSMGLFLVGSAIGVVRQSLMAAATGVGSAIMVQYTPTIIESIVTGCF